MATETRSWTRLLLGCFLDLLPCKGPSLVSPKCLLIQTGSPKEMGGAAGRFLPQLSNSLGHRSYSFLPGTLFPNSTLECKNKIFTLNSGWQNVVSIGWVPCLFLLGRPKTPTPKNSECMWEGLAPHSSCPMCQRIKPMSDMSNSTELTHSCSNFLLLQYTLPQTQLLTKNSDSWSCFSGGQNLKSFQGIKTKVVSEMCPFSGV